MLTASFVVEAARVLKVLEVEACHVVLACWSDPLLTEKPESARAPLNPTDPLAGLEMVGVLRVAAGAAVVKLIAAE